MKAKELFQLLIYAARNYQNPGKRMIAKAAADQLQAFYMGGAAMNV